MKSKLGRLEALRGFAAFYVVIHHTFRGKLMLGGIDLSFLFRFGQEAVILFFVLSGFVIELAYNRSSDKSFSTFFQKRFFRIYIPLVFAFLLNIVFNWQALSQAESFPVRELVGNLFMLQDVSALKTNVICDPFLGNDPLWSLSYEWWFYMLFFALRTRFGNRSSSIVYIVSVVAAVSYCFYPFFVNRELMYFIIWWIGADIARLYVAREKINLPALKKPMLALVACIVALAANVWFNRDSIAAELGLRSIGVSPYLELRHFVFAGVAVCLALLWAKMNWIFFRYSIGLFERFASFSFGVYILHWFMISHATYMSFLHNQVLEYVVYFVVCFATAYLIERVIYPRLSSFLRHKLSGGPKTTIEPGR
ncbi:MAG: acyltransferase [Chitinophagaceae bacterium]|nr:MAG: acyltransferase [Chitinophagaceae bacterium]